MPGPKPTKDWQPQAIIDWYECELEYVKLEHERWALKVLTSPTHVSRVRFPYGLVLLGALLLFVGLLTLVILLNKIHPTP